MQAPQRGEHEWLSGIGVHITWGWRSADGARGFKDLIIIGAPPTLGKNLGV